MGNVQRNFEAEFEQGWRDQEDPRWLEWVDPDLMSAQISRFLTETVPDMPDDPWSADGLDRAEMFALKFFASIDAVDRPENRDLADQITRFIGEVFRRNFEGIWYNVLDYGGCRYQGFGPVIRTASTGAYLDPANLITAAVHLYWADYWSEIFRKAAQDHRDWVDVGRPPLPEWIND